MTEHKTFPGKVYTVSCAVDTTVVLPDPLGVKEDVVLECTAGAQLHVTATAGRLLTSSDQAIVTELFKGAPGSNVAPGAIVAAQVAARDAKDAAVRAEAAAGAVVGAAQVGGNNTFTATNTFNGALVANGSLLYEQQELGDLLNYPVAAWLLENGVHPASALAKTWEEWVFLNPAWEEMGSLLFYAPLMQGAIPKFDSISSPFTRCMFISPANISNSNCQYLLSQNFTLYSLKAGTCGDVYNCYNVKKCSFYVPKVTEFREALNAVGYSNREAALELSVYAPELRDIYINGINTSFWRIGLLKSFSIYAPKLVSSFSFSRQTNSGKGQTCAILHSLIAGIGTPETVQTITTITPSDGDIIQTVIEDKDGEQVEVEKTNKTVLEEAAAAKNWEFIFV